MGACLSTTKKPQKVLEVKPEEAKAPKTFAETYDLGEELGSGAFAVVKAGTRKSPPANQSFAIKIITKSKLSEDDAVALKDEIGVLQEMKHGSVIRLYEVFDEAEYHYLVTERMMGGELFDRIVQKSYYNEKEARDTCKILFDAIRYCHSKKIAHRDLKPENLLLASRDSDSEIKIADFGFAKKCPRPGALTTQCGTPGYVAPEILKQLPYDTQVDLWSLGVIVFILLGGYPPFHGDNKRELFSKIRKGEYEFHEEYWGPISEEGKNFISSLLQVNPTKRITAEDAMNDAWVKQRDEILLLQDLGPSLINFKAFNAKRKLKAAVHAVMITRKFDSLGVDFKKDL